MRKTTFFLIATLSLLLALDIQAQVTIGAITEPNATLDVRKGTAKADRTIVTADLSDNSVTSAKIVNGTIVADDIFKNAGISVCKSL